MTFAMPDDLIDTLAHLLNGAHNPYRHVNNHPTVIRACEACEWDQKRDDALEYADGLRQERESFAREHDSTEREESR